MESSRLGLGSEATNALLRPQEVAGSIPARPTESTVSVEEWASTWLSMLLIKPKTRTFYEGVLRSRILPTFAERTLDSLSRLDVQQWVVGLSSEVSASHVRNCHSVLKQMYLEAMAHRLVDHNPCESIRLPKRIEPDKRPLSLDEVRRVASHAGRYEDFILTLAMTGLRWAECVGLTPDAIEDNSIVVSSSLTEIGGRFERVPTKTNKVRRVPVPPALQGHLNVPFQTYYSNPIRGAGFRERVWYPAIEKAGVRKVNVHSLRATCASELVRAGASVVLVSRWLGHSTPQTTLKRYAFLFDTDLQDIAQLVG